MVTKMEKRNLAVVIGIGTILIFSACGRQRPDASDLAADREKRTVPYHENSTDMLPEGENNTDALKKDEKKGKKEADDEAAQEKLTEKTGVVFGSPEAYGCKDFNYLTEEEISTTKNASHREAAFSVYVPKEERERVSEASARGERAGVYVKVDLEPYLQYKAENYSLSNNLNKYVTGEMSYYENYYDVIVGNIEETDDNAVCEVSYMAYDFSEDTYAPYYVVYSLYDLGDNVMALVTLSIDAENTTEETRGLVDELSSFYQIDIHWDESFAQAKREKFEDKYTGNIFTLDSLSFKLPDGWAMDEYVSDEYGTVYAPDGDSEKEAGYFAVMMPEEAFGMVELFLEDMEYLQEMLEEELADEADSVAIADIGMTFLGHTVKIEMTLHTDEEAGSGVLYIAEDDKNLYMFYVFTPLGEKDGLSKEVQEAIDMFFETGQVSDRFM